MLRNIRAEHNGPILDAGLKKPKDRYRIQFCDPDFYKRHQDIFALWKTRFRKLSDVKKVQAWVVGLCCLRRPKDWYGGARNDIWAESENLIPPAHSLTLAEIFESTTLTISPKLNADINLTDFIRHFKIKAVPESCFRSLHYLNTGHYPLVITTHTPNAEELLSLQLQGKRLITLNENYEDWPDTLYAGRDFLGFVMHDLIHADHFFKTSDHRDGQLAFYHFVEGFLSDPNLKKLLASDTFKEGFEYIISDMNSHPLHLFQTLHSLLFSEVKNDSQASFIWGFWTENSKLTETQKRAILLINSIDFEIHHAHTIESMRKQCHI